MTGRSESVKLPVKRNNGVLLLPCVAVLAGLQLFRSAWAAILLYHAVIIIYLVLTSGGRPRPGLIQGWNAPAGVGMIILCASSGPLLVFLWPVISDVRDDLPAALESFGLRGAWMYLFAAYFVTVHPVLEECFWRGAMAPADRRIGTVDMAFAAYHVLVLVHFLKFPWVIAAALLLVLVSWLWRRVAEYSRGLAIPIFSHIAAGLGVMTAAFIIASR